MKDIKNKSAIDTEKQELLLDLIIVAVKGFVAISQNKEEEEDDLEKTCKAANINFSYLLGQAIRQWQIPEDNWHVSEAAQELWKKITSDEEISRFVYKETFTCAATTQIPCFLGTKRKFEALNITTFEEKEKYAFNEIFISEHTIPVSDIRDAIVECYKNHRSFPCRLRGEIRAILNKMHITRMLKVEDRRININTKRIATLSSYPQYGSIYKYLKYTTDNIYEEICKKCYSDLEYSKERLENEKLQEYKNFAYTHSWAKSIDISSIYSIIIEQTKTNN